MKDEEGGNREEQDMTLVEGMFKLWEEEEKMVDNMNTLTEGERNCKPEGAFELKKPM